MKPNGARDKPLPYVAGFLFRVGQALGACRIPLRCHLFDAPINEYFIMTSYQSY